MSKLIGKSPNQVPSNADLGTAAFMDAKDFLTSKGSSLSKINATIPSTAVDVLVYNTALDSDGGAWRKKSSNTSWYNEKLNTIYRGSRKEFPAVAVIVATAQEITIYDGDDASLPMWMKIKELGGALSSLGWATGGTITISKIAMLNGSLIAGCGLDGSGGGAIEYNFPADDTILYYDSSEYELESSRLIVDRHEAVEWKTTTSAGSGYELVDYRIYDIDMRVLPGAKTHHVTGLPIPTKVFATGAGISIVHDDGTVADWSSLGQRSCKLSDERMYIGYLGNGRVYVEPIWTKDVANYAGGLSANVERHYHSTAAVDEGADDDLNYIDKESGEATISGFRMSVLKNDRFAVGCDGGLSIFRENPQVPSKGMVAFVGSDFNTGYMLGDCKLASLCNTDFTGNIDIARSPNLIDNGDFASDISGWSGDSGAVLSYVGARLRVARETGGDYTYAAAQNNNNWVAGDHLYVSLDIYPSDSGRMRIRIGGSEEQWFETNVTGSTWQTVSFTAIAEGSRIEIASNVGSPTIEYFDIDNVVVKKIVVPDHRAKGRGFIGIGDVQAVKVAPGSDIVAFTNFQSGNYSSNRMEVPFSEDLLPGSGDYMISMWLKDVAVGVDIIGLGKRGTDLCWNIYHDAGGGLRMHVSANGTSYESIVEAQFGGAINNWTHAVFIKKDEHYHVYINGQLMHENKSSGSETLYDTSRPLMIGAGHTNSSINSNLKISMLKISKTAPNVDQIRAIYDSEKVFFGDNVKVTLHGDEVNALAYDRVTEDLHVGNNTGRTVFNGLVRKEYTTDPVTTAISASNGMVVEE